MNLYDELIIILQDGKELGFTYDEIDDIIKALERAKKVEKELEEYKISDKSKEESSIEYYNLYKETKCKLKKVEELLELFKQLSLVNYNMAITHGGEDYYENKREIIIKKIKALEEELK